MADTAGLRATIKVCMFDQYGTVVDMQTGLTAVAAPYLRSKGWPGDPHSFVTWWRRTHFENSMIDALLGREHTPYREIGHRSVAWVLERAGIPHTMDEVRHLVAQIETLRPFPEVPEALAPSRPGSRSSFSAGVGHAEAAKPSRTPFDTVISAVVARSNSRTPGLPRSSRSRW
jgi:2-haloacid dehalogenase